MLEYKIYIITNLITKKQYVGQTIHTIENRFKQHCSKNSTSRFIRNSIRKYGQDNFKIDHLCSAKNIENANYLEEYFINKYNTLAPNGYNLKHGGDYFSMSEVTKQQMSKSQIERQQSITPEEKAKQVRGMTEYVNAKKRKVIGVHSQTFEILRFDSTTEAKIAGFYIDSAIAGTNGSFRAKKYYWFYDEDQEESYFIEKTKEKHKEWEIKHKKWHEQHHKLMKGNPKTLKPLIAVNVTDYSTIEFSGVKDAVKQGFSASQIYGCLRGENKSSNGYYFFYKSSEIKDYPKFIQEHFLPSSYRRFRK